ncbi:aminotransferase class I/II-fold pyridoxal phosphate-dependent enzyme [Muricauda sp. JGD-17]|uniref:Aminotransferase class I/II-fold pyridoxal phosphate-dependent enzyme n=1 Tax=Flagellimonas ochracea TaxID=2696472 RepID=A0A964TCY0_9FLAO|nr:pyridoxal phosphate-dependent aminotransferase family protein [Allomuricauda ochracea]NAY91949.1 aminotransferase class I/II-fold pyridoxal phosphate-dependent enzyme [Allomuricauda ochracea]
MAELPKKLIQKLEKRRSEDALRHLPESLELVDFSSNDYLGFAQNEDLTRATTDLTSIPINTDGSTGSRLLTGNHILYAQLEQKLADFHGTPSALVFNSGYDANIGFFSSVPQRGDIVFYDELVHASIRDGLQMGKANTYKFAHNNLEQLKEKTRLLRARTKSDNQTVYVVTESVFSMDGDSPNLGGLADFCSVNGFHLVVDEAHAVGIFGNGKGLLNQLGLENEVFARIITFGKAFGRHGAAILAGNRLKEYLINFARSLIYTTALPPHSIAAILASYAQMETSGKTHRKKLLENIRHFNDEIMALELIEVFIPSDSAIQCAVISENQKVKEISGQLQQSGFNVKPILSPTVKKGDERLRFCLHSYNTNEEISRVLLLLKNLLT